MSWHYQARQHKVLGVRIIDVVEVFSGDIGYTAVPSIPEGDNKEELIRDLEMMLADVKMYGVLKEKEKK